MGAGGGRAVCCYDTGVPIYKGGLQPTNQRPKKKKRWAEAHSTQLRNCYRGDDGILGFCFSVFAGRMGFRLRSFIGKAEIAPPSFPRKRESEHVRRETYIPSFPRKWESRTSEFSDNGGFAFEVQLSLTEKGQYAVAYGLSCKKDCHELHAT
ncbi:hypothetical protein, partial [Neisseria meningitidis]